ncbi:guanylate kinase [Lachnospiraceae bacterium JLR.KK008]
MKRRGILVVVSGFSGAGKGTLMKELVRTYDAYALSVSMTTRSPRPGEEDGKEYFFVSRETFEHKIAGGELIEYASYCGNYYGTPREYVEMQLARGKDVILEIEIQGALKVKERFPSALLLFVTPPSIKELKRRLIGRGTETEEVVSSRLSRACEEAEGIEKYDYLVVNDDLDTCVREMHGLIEGAHSAPVRNQEFIENIRMQLQELVKGEK